ncbi:MAG: zinc-ribbon domain-containing protein [Thermoproteota archaeon]
MSQRTCPRCGATVEAGDEFCSLCGLQLPWAGERARPDIFGEAAYADEARLRPAKPTVKSAPPVRTPALKKCPNCNASVRDDLKFCPNCGFNLEVARIRLRQRQQGAQGSYSRKEFFSFEGYEIEGVPMTSLMLVIWAVWCFGVAAASFLQLIQPQLPPPFSAVEAWGFNLVIGILSVLSAIGLLMVIRPLFYVILALVLLELPVSLMQLFATPTNPSSAWENFATGLIGLFIVIGLTIQLLRIHKYFIGTGV